MTRNLTNDDLDVLAACEAKYRPAADPAEAAEAESAMRAMAMFLVVLLLTFLAGVIALAGYFLKS